MGRWSRPIAAKFLDWLAMREELDWLDVGCGTGALSAAIMERCQPRSLIAIDPSQGFLAKARDHVKDPRAEFQIGDAQSLPLANDSRDVVASGLVLNFVPDRVQALSEMRRVTRPGGTVGFYVWDYPGGGVEFMRAFWQTATALDAGAVELTEDRRFPFCTPEGLADIAKAAGLEPLDFVALESPSVFRDFEDYWRPFTLGAGPAPGYCASLAPEARQRLMERLSERLPRCENGSIVLGTRAWACRARVD
ncbi:MAG: class I SAM-dependent methyltransferase [Alphaproteobacteria bacterium]